MKKLPIGTGASNSPRGKVSANPRQSRPQISAKIAPLRNFDLPCCHIRSSAYKSSAEDGPMLRNPFQRAVSDKVPNSSVIQ
jgi:hypothetical protein